MNFLSIDYTKLFYWLTVADNAKTFFAIFAIFFCAVFVITTLVRFTAFLEDGGPSEGYLKKINKWTWYSTPFMVMFLSLWIFTPSKKDALLIIAGGQTVNFLTSDESAKQIPKELSSFVLTELKQMASEAKVELGIQNQKDKILEAAKDMSAQELINYMKSDSTVAKIILNDKL
jgi:heme/copper-type cytochrome/quinol oxidase subunit 4